MPIRRKMLELPEVFMSANEWDKVNYSRVASICMANNAKHFLYHDEVRFGAFLKDVKTGKAKIASSALLPHEFVGKCLYSRGLLTETQELQWNDLVQRMKEKGSFENCLAVCDVSGSMTGTPLEAAIALSMILAEMSEEPWKNRICTFSERPAFHVISGDTLTVCISFFLFQI